jgi:hypothetical protein
MVQGRRLVEALGAKPEQLLWAYRKGLIGGSVRYLGVGRERGLWLSRRAAYQAALRLLITAAAKRELPQIGISSVTLDIPLREIYDRAHAVVDELFKA